MKVPVPNPIEYLLRRKFDFPPSGSDAGLNRPQLKREEIEAKRKDDEAKRQAFEAYRVELEAKSLEEIKALYDEELARDRAEQSEKVDREEHARFFHQPSAAADFAHWSKAAYWTRDEAVALTFGKAPEKVNTQNLKRYLNVSPFAKQYGQVIDLAMRSGIFHHNRVQPSLFLVWAERTGIAIPAELVAAVKARSARIADWKTLFDNLSKRTAEEAEASSALMVKQKAVIEQLTARCNDLEGRLADYDAKRAETAKDIGTRERDSLLKLIIGMAVGGYAYDPAQKRSDKLPDIVDDLERAGVPLDADTVRKWIKEAAELLPPKQIE